MGTEAAALTDEHLLAEIRSAAAGIRHELERLTDESARQPSELPGWTRGHVLAHIQGISAAVGRQVEYARRGEQVELYDGGQLARDQAIEDGAHATADECRERVGAALDGVLDEFAALKPGEWDARVRFRNGVVRDAAFALWRELVIHHTDLGTGCSQQEWSSDFCHHLLGFLEPRVPQGETFYLRPHHGEEIRLGDGSDGVIVEGRLQDLAAWLAGREVGRGSVRAEHAGEAVSLPAIGPWPSALAVK
ncbi:maleylpyruvate isomerase family mycothiol-dependent enzyme [Sinomonas terrae]|uniref:Maleylpyruvate isomerase family mycothiol-dependent enzyme n=1 Tax=Sinomonas terrae TaxID=2908838 RepID=A0ABS9U2M3_9MICC|nr:maleylpyruvate isomerase family mycothiol-dependent enzyme [Sinomonas terrae]MCH6470850.1 maleylpyruvate isomerase family mycothiol-dependent enzyme [Sinomonas terrae]